MKDDFALFSRDYGVTSTQLFDYKSKFDVNCEYSYVSPTIIEERQLNVAQMDVFSRLMMDRVMFLGAEINDTVANIIVSQLLYLDSTENSKIHLYINSPGGSVTAGYAIYDVMKSISSEVYTLCVGLSASMASVILSGGTKGKRFAMPHSKIMIHQPLGGISGQASDIEIASREIIKVKESLYKTLAENTGKSFDEIKRDSDRDFWMTADEAVEYGIIDKVKTFKNS